MRNFTKNIEKERDNAKSNIYDTGIVTDSFGSARACRDLAIENGEDIEMANAALEEFEDELLDIYGLRGLARITKESEEVYQLILKTELKDRRNW